MSTYKTRPIGEVFRYNKAELQVVECEDCKGCFFWSVVGCLNQRGNTGYCDGVIRTDYKSVIFKRIDKKL